MIPGKWRQMWEEVQRQPTPEYALKFEETFRILLTTEDVGGLVSLLRRLDWTAID